MVGGTQFLGPLQGDQPTLPAPACRTLRVPPQPRALALASGLRSSLAVHFLDHWRLLAADDPSTSPYPTHALLPMSVLLIEPSALIPLMRPNRLRLPLERFIGDSALSLESPGLHGIEVLKRPCVMCGW